MTSKDLEMLRRWEDGGGTWEILARTAGTVHLALLSCTGHEQMGRLDSAQPDVLAHVTGGGGPSAGT